MKYIILILILLFGISEFNILQSTELIENDNTVVMFYDVCSDDKCMYKNFNTYNSYENIIVDYF